MLGTAAGLSTVVTATVDAGSRDARKVLTCCLRLRV